MWRRMILLNEKTATSMSTALTMKGACVHRNSGTTLLPCRWCTRPLQQLHIYQTVRHHNPEDSNLVAHCCEGPKSRREKEHPLAPTFWNTKIKKYQGLQREKNCTVLYTTFCKMEGGQEGGAAQGLLLPAKPVDLFTPPQSIQTQLGSPCSYEYIQHRPRIASLASLIA